MKESQRVNVTKMLLQWGKGDEDALSRLTPLVYEQLRNLARRHLRQERPGHTLQTTALVNEAYLRLVDQKRVRWQNRAHFFAIAAEIMRRILVDYARHKQSAKRGGQAQRISLDAIPDFSDELAADVIAVHQALNQLHAVDPRKSKVVELRFFGGLSVEETAEVLGVSPNTVYRDWKMAKAWLYRQLRGGSL